MRLNIGCGGKRLEGYTGVDKFATPAVDIITPAQTKGKEEYRKQGDIEYIGEKA